MSAAVRHLRSALLGAAAALAACARLSGDAGPRPLSVTPTGAYRGQAARVRITGTGYQVRGVQHLGGSGEVSTAFEVRIGGRLLADAVYVGAENGHEVLEATVPADLGAGVHDLEVRDPYGLSGVLPQAFTESDRAPPSLATSVTAPAAAEAGVAFPVAIEIANQGEEAAQLDTVSLAGTPLGSAAGQIIAGRGTLMLHTAALSAQPGPYDLDVRIAATDTVTGLALPQVAQPVPVQILVPPALVLRPLAPPPAVDVGQSFALDLEVANGGEIDALAVQSVLASGGALSGPPPAPQDVPAASVRTFHFLVQGGAPGTVIAQGSAAGMDAITSSVVQAPPVPFGPVAVQLPTALRVADVSVPARVSLGQIFMAAITVANDGDADALAVQDAGAALPGMTVLSAPGAVPVDGHSTATFAWILRASQLGASTLTLAVQGSDANSGAPVSASAQAPIQVQSPAALAVQVAVPTKVSVGQTFTVTATVADTGEAGVTQLAMAPPDCGPSLLLLQSPAVPAQLPGSASAVLAWTYRATAAGTASCAAATNGVDANSSSPVAAQATSTPMSVQTPAALSISSIQLPARISRGQAFAAIVTAANGGEATALAVRPSALVVATGGPAAAIALPAAQDVPGGASRSFTISAIEDGTGTGTLALDVAAAGSDGNSASPVTAATVRSAAAIVEEPSALRADSFAVPAAVSQGQSFVATLQVTNTGQATATGVVPGGLTITTTGGAAAVVLSGPPAKDVAGSATATFSWTLRETGTAPGTLQVSARAAGADANSGAPVSASGTSPTIQVQTPAALSVSAFTFPPAISRGQTFTVGATIANSGGAAASSVQPRLLQIVAGGGAAASVTAAPAAADIPGGTSAAFTWRLTENGTASGTLAFEVDAVGADANSGAALSAAPVTSPSVPVQTPAGLSVTSFTVQSSRGLSTIDRGQAFTVRITVANPGEASAAGVSAAPSPPTVAITGGAHATLTTAPTAAVIAGGSTATFTCGYVEDGAAAGTLTFSAGASGSDANSGAAIVAASASAALTVQTAAALAATLSAPATVPLGNQFTLSLQVTNTGDATATAVAPSAPISTGTGAISAPSGPSPSSATLAGHTSVTFTWTVGTLASGPVQIAVVASGTDDNDGGRRTASASTSMTVSTPPESAQLSADPFSADGSTFSYLFSYQGMVYLGPNKSGTAAVRMAPDGSSLQTVSWQLEVDQVTPARNGVYVTSPSNPTPPPCHTIGSATCKQGTAACGPDNEFGRGLLISGVVSGVEWYALSGPSPTGGSRYVYLTNGTLPLAAGGYDDLAFVQIASGQTGAARMISSGAFANDRLYLGLFDEGGSFTPPTAPVLNAVVTMPALPGYVASASTDLINLQAVNLPAVGASGIPANSGKIWLMIDSMASLGTSLYVANNGGIARSVGSPTPCATPGCANWANATPSPATWTAKTSVTIDKTVLGALEPAEKAVPGMVAFGSRFFAARNTTTGPQLWSCNPALGADPAQCESGDWSLVAPNSSGDTQLTQFNNASNSAITLLVATAQHLYLGFNDAAGVQIFRTAIPSASARSDFTGQAGCNAATASCRGLGGDGLGAGATRLFDGHAFTYSQLEWVYLSAGDGSTAPRIFRLAP